MLFKECDWFDFYSDAKEDINPNSPESRGHEVSISMLVDVELEGDKSTRRIHTGVFIFISKDPIHWYIKRQATIEVSNFGAELFSMKAGG